MAKLSFEDFKNYINDIKSIIKLQDDINKISTNFNKDSKEEFYFYFPSGIDNIIKLLALITDDKNEWIDYWIYELDFGRRADDLVCKDDEGNIIPLHTLEDLWTLINQNEE